MLKSGKGGFKQTVDSSTRFRLYEETVERDPSL
jgi:hypothetical protein